MLLASIHTNATILKNTFIKYNEYSYKIPLWAMYFYTMLSIIYQVTSERVKGNYDNYISFDMGEYYSMNEVLSKELYYSDALGLTSIAACGLVIYLGFCTIFFFGGRQEETGTVTVKGAHCIVKDTTDALSIPTETFSVYTNDGTRLSLNTSRIYTSGKSTNGEIFSLNSLFDINNTNLGQAGVIDAIAPASAEFRGILELYHLVMYILYLVSFTLIVLAVAALNQYSVKFSRIANSCYSNGFEIYRLANITTLLSAKTGYAKSNDSDCLIDAFDDIIDGTADNVGAFKRHIVSVEGTVYWVYHSYIEFVWTLIPCLALLFISLPSFTLALALDEAHKPSDWIKVIGNQWFWVYEYSTYEDDIVIFSNIVQGDELAASSNNSRALRMLEVDNSITIRVNKFTRFLITSTDVIHSWAVPALGVKVDACPGRIATVTVLPTRLGVFYGQCSEICGVNHGFMPICVEVVA